MQDKINEQVKSSFQKVREDMERLRSRIEALEQERNELKKEVENLKNTPISAQSQPSISENSLRLRLEKMAGKPLKEQYTKALDNIEIPETENFDPPSPKKEQVEDQLKKDILRSYERNRKNIVKHHILSEIQQRNLTKIELRDVVVEQKKYCSKASFYRYLDELENERRVHYKRKNKRNVISPDTL